ncbi:MAG: aminoacetone oxidase family FAD-binding enzyme, partial [Sphaerochaetaceae bacterium]
MFDVVIIGGGAAGLFLAANLPTNNAILLDHKEAVGKKLLITGGGMCNLTNTQPPNEFVSHYGDRTQRNFLLPSLQAFPPSALMEWFEEKGVPLLIREDGKVFPASLDAHQIRDVLSRESKATIQYNTNISAITRNDNGFTITTNKGILQSKMLVLATGGMSYPRTGSDGSGYALAKSLGHSIIPPKPALAAIAIEGYHWKHLAGNAVRSVSAKFYHSGEKKPFREAVGDILFTHDGLSGPLVLTASRELIQGDTITFSLLPMEHKATVQQHILSLLG